jgi:hypothetical protein
VQRLADNASPRPALASRLQGGHLLDRTQDGGVAQHGGLPVVCFLCDLPVILPRATVWVQRCSSSCLAGSTYRSHRGVMQSGHRTGGEASSAGYSDRPVLRREVSASPCGPAMESRASSVKARSGGIARRHDSNVRIVPGRTTGPVSAIVLPRVRIVAAGARVATLAAMLPFRMP